jgi:predicted unusual protein kinase regulating ubiquinone biosynthesis (AarF/ABC1/UbiB family)
MDRSTPVGKAARLAVAGATAAKVGARKLELLSKRPFLSPESFERRQAESDHEIAEVLFRGLGTLRGGAVKLAQMMSLELGLLPDAYRKELYKSHYQVPPLNRAVVRQLITSEFGRPPEEIFETFETTAFAAASLGQVHKARSRAGEPLAVKVQYPGIGTALKNDLQLLKQFLLPFVRGEYISNAVQELERRLFEETDYDLERRTTQWFHEHGQMPGVVVPRTFAEYSSTLVLATEFVDGLHLDRWLRVRRSQEQRDHVAQNLYDFFTRSLVEGRTVHGDPNPGNYLFREDGTVAVIDFGAVKVFQPELCERLLALWRAHIHGDVEQVITHYCGLGIGGGDRRVAAESYHRVLAPFDEWSRLPYQEDVFDFGKHVDYCARGAKIFRDTMRSKEMDGFTPETVLFDRNIYGLYRMFTELKARVRMKNRWIF